MKKFKIENLSKSYDDVSVLKDINLELEESEFLVLVGPSGCGKSTLLSCIAGLDVVNSGSVYIGDKNVTKDSPKDRGIAMVFQTYALYPNMNVRENIEFGLKIKNFSKEEIDKRVMDSSKLLHIDHLLDRKPSQLSGGQRQRVAIGRAISREPDVYLFDEPLSNLDAELRVKMRVEIKKLHKEMRRTIIYVTHDQVEAMTLADKIAIMKDGVLQQFGTPNEVYSNPNNLFTAGFIGSPSMNFIDVVLQEDSNGFYINFKTDDAPVRVDIPKDEALKGYIGKEVIAGLRPEHIQNGFRDDRIYNELKDISLKVNLYELTGADGYLLVTLNDKEILCRVSPSGIKEIGEKIDLKVWAKKILFFDKETENRIK